MRRVDRLKRMAREDCDYYITHGIAYMMSDELPEDYSPRRWVDRELHGSGVSHPIVMRGSRTFMYHTTEQRYAHSMAFARRCLRLLRVTAGESDAQEKLDRIRQALWRKFPFCRAAHDLLREYPGGGVVLVDGRFVLDEDRLAIRSAGLNELWERERTVQSIARHMREIKKLAA